MSDPDTNQEATVAQTNDPLRRWISENVAKSEDDADRLLASLQDAIAAEMEDHNGILVDEGDRFMILGKGEVDVEANDPGNTALIKTVALQPGDIIIHVKAQSEVAEA